ncbi:type II asparaginase [Domibacillus indicus]|uniref:type II asparaginase n=1 Tax=Domibacillus indicus TaxID=1437523 RepID=UPI00203EFA90|nr:type II asparaginase [Domibacillus indicus]MCM3790053.1 type II asparaginase [Domibacillus indicus]
MRNKSTIKIIATGGTIAGAGTSSTMTTGYQPGALSIDELLKEVPDLANVANIKVEQLFNIDSVDMTTERLLALSKYINETLLHEEVDGVVITHGTDTLEETDYFLHLVIKSHKPVVIVGAVRPATAISAEGPLNIYNGVKVACDKKSHGKGVLVVLNDRIGSARYMTKMNTTMVDSFKALEQGYIGSIVGGEVYYFYKDITYRHTTETAFDVRLINELSKVSTIYAHQGDDRYLYDAAVQAGAKGIVVATAGGYTISKQAEAGIHDALNKGVIVIRSSRLNTGIVSRTDMDNQHGYIVSESLNPPKARILLMLALSLTNDKNEIQQYFHIY